jgi:4-amino-4-deoxy-L-arabinose transferase-like glycosyltransferase
MSEHDEALESRLAGVVRRGLGVRVDVALVVALVAFGACVVKFPAVVALVVPAAAAVLVLVLLVRRLTPGPHGELDERVLRWTLLVFGVHVLLGMAITHSSAVSTYFGPDAQAYHDGAIQLTRHWAGAAGSPALPSGKEGFFYVLGFLYEIFGAHVESGLVFNAMLSAALVPLLTDVTRRLFGREATRAVAPLVLLLPGLLIWTSQLLREAAVLFLIVAAVDIALRLLDGANLANIVGLGMVLALLFTFRANVAFVVLGGLAVGVIISRRHVVSGLGLGAGILSASLLLVVSAGIGYSGYRTAADADLGQVNAIRLDSSTSAASGFSQTHDVSTPAGAAAYLPYGLTQFIVGPFPWQVHTVRQLPALLDVAVLWCLAPSLWRGVRESRRRRQRAAFVLLIPAAITACMLALLVANFGTVVRERTQVLVLLVPFISLGLAMRAGEGVAEAHVEARAAVSG